MKAIFHAIIVGLAVIVSAAACTPVRNPSILEKVEQEKKVVIGVRNDNPPMSYVDESGAWVGFDVDLANAIASQLGATAELVVVDGTTRSRSCKTVKLTWQLPA